jgi:hypothetical protein
VSRVKDVPTSRETTGEPTERGAVHPACDERRLRQLLSVGPAVTFAFRLEGQQPTTFISENVATVVGWPADRFYADPSFWTRHLHPTTPKASLATAGWQLPSVASEYRFNAATAPIADARRRTCCEMRAAIRSRGSASGST